MVSYGVVGRVGKECNNVGEYCGSVTLCNSGLGLGWLRRGISDPFRWKRSEFGGVETVSS